MKDKPDRPDWSGQTVVCIASGPSLTAEDCELVKGSGFKTIVTNTTFRLCPWADVLFAMDSRWWKEHGLEACKRFPGVKLSTSHAARSWGAQSLYGCHWFPQGLNSGAGAIGWALGARAGRIVLLGYDCQKTGGRTHHHGDHPKSLGNAASLKHWPKHFKMVARDAEKLGIEVVNATRETALTCFKRVSLEEALGQKLRQAA